MTNEKETCPNCGSDHVDRDAVDIGVGTQYGPLGCLDCGWSEQGQGEQSEAEARAESEIIDRLYDLPRDEEPR